MTRAAFKPLSYKRCIDALLAEHGGTRFNGTIFININVTNCQKPSKKSSLHNRQGFLNQDWMLFSLSEQSCSSHPFRMLTSSHLFFRLPVNTSLFYYEGGEPKCREKTKDFCQCLTVDGRVSSNCNFANIADRPEYKRTGWTVLESPGSERCRRRKKRSTSSDISLPNDSKSMFYVYDPTPLPRVNTTWPTALGKTQN